jgi:two-component system phosphate regulon response regulator PhoB
MKPENLTGAQGTPKPEAQKATTLYDDGYLRIERENYYTACGGQPISLMRKGFLILWRLAQNPERVVAAQEVWRYAWGSKAQFNSASLRVHISRLRHTLAPFGISIENMAGVGYRLSIPARKSQD